MDPSTLRTDELADYIDQRYADRARQLELDRLECIFAARVTEEDISMCEDELSVTEMELNVGEESVWVSLEEQLMHMYYRYISPETRRGMETEDIIGNMCAAVNSYPGAAGDAETFAPAAIVSAGRDAYERRMSLLQRLLQSNRRFGVDVYDYLSRVGGNK
jgi:hypothetical protein